MNKIIELLKNSNDIDYVAKALYNFGYLPDIHKYKRIYKEIIDSSKVYKYCFII